MKHNARNDNFGSTETQINFTHDLPDDIFHDIFHALALLDPPRTPRCEGMRTSWNTGSLGWTCITHVCGRWRSIALAMCALWADIACVFPLGVETVIQRANNVPLTLYFDQKDFADAIWDVVNRLGALQRARTLECTQYSFSQLAVRDWSLYLLDQQLPLLQSLTLYLDSFTDADSSPHQPLYVPSLRRLTTNIPLAITAPALSYLHTVGAIWHLPLFLDYLKRFTTITTLHIETIFGDSRSLEMDIPTKVLAVAEQMNNRSIGTHAVRLPYLRSLEIDNARQNAPYLLKSLETPACDRFVVETLWAHEDLPDLLRVLRATCHVNLNVLTLFARGNADRSIDISFTEENPYVGRPDGTDSRAFTRGVLIGHLTANDRWTNKVPSTLNTVPFPSSISTLALDHTCAYRCDKLECGAIMWDLSPVDFAQSLRPFQNVTTLHLVGQGGGIKIPTVLGCNLDSAHGKVLPSLREFVISMQRPTSHIWWMNLRTALKARLDSGFQVSRLVVRGEGACHAYKLGRSNKERAKAYAEVSAGLTGRGAVLKWLKHCEITLADERKLVTELSDERSAKGCRCAAGASQGKHPWEFIKRAPESDEWARVGAWLAKHDLEFPAV